MFVSTVEVYRWVCLGGLIGSVLSFFWCVYHRSVSGGILASLYGIGSLFLSLVFWSVDIDPDQPITEFLTESADETIAEIEDDNEVPLNPKDSPLISKEDALQEVAKTCPKDCREAGMTNVTCVKYCSCVQEQLVGIKDFLYRRELQRLQGVASQRRVEK